MFHTTTFYDSSILICISYGGYPTARVRGFENEVFQIDVSLSDYLLDVVAPVQFESVLEDESPEATPGNQRNLSGPTTQDILGYFRGQCRFDYSVDKINGKLGYHLSLWG